jgi:cyclopropane fatty-acyl-phospholipid synthase-like methyltransferase
VLKPCDLERIVPDLVRSGETTGDESLRLHVERYEFAKLHLLPGSVLDIACGSGYGTAILASSTISTALGVDISEDAVCYARGRYGSSKISFACSDALNFAPQSCFENVVSLETLEHLREPFSIFRHLLNMASPSGRIIASVPVTPSIDANPHHASNFSERSFLRLGRVNSLIEVDKLHQTQPYNPFHLLRKTEARMEGMRHNLATFYLRHPHHLWLRGLSTLRYGLTNRYLTVVWQKPA